MNSNGIDLQKKVSDILSSLINSTLYNLGTFVLQQAYCNIASGESRNTSYRLEAVSVWSVAVITLTPALSLKGEGVC